MIRFKKFGFARAIRSVQFALFVIPALQAQPEGTVLSSGEPVKISLPSVASGSLFAGAGGYRIAVPADATRLVVNVTYPNPTGYHIDPYHRFDRELAFDGSGRLLTDTARIFRETFQNQLQASIVIDDRSQPLIRQGTYYIGLYVRSVFGGSTGPIVGTITATITRPPGGPPPACLYSVLIPTSFGVQPSPVSLGIPVSTSTGCAWNAASDSSWLRLGTTAGVGPATIPVTIAANTEPAARTAKVTIGKQPDLATVTITQDVGCAYRVSPESVQIPVAGGSGSIAVTSAPGCQWRAVSDASWLAVTSGGSGTASGSIAYLVEGNQGELRSGRITVAGQVHTAVSQAGAPVPTISQGGVSNGASLQPAVSPGSWIAIKGTNLSGTSPGRTWRPSEIVNRRLPTSLDGVSVTVNGKPAYVYYVSPTQINILSPAETAVGQVPVVVTNNGVKSNVAMVQMDPIAPALFRAGSTKYALATRFPDNAVVANPSLVPGSVPAAPGDVLILWGTGLGPTTPPAEDGSQVAGQHLLAINPTVLLGNDSVEVLGAALSPGSAGLYQVAIRVPVSVPNGDVPITLTVGGFRSASDTAIYAGTRLP